MLYVLVGSISSKRVEMRRDVFNEFYNIRYHWMIGASTRENLSSGVCENTGADQPAHPRRLISAFVIRLLRSIISRLATSEISIF